MPDPTQLRYHLALAIDGRPVIHGWWKERAVADRKRLGWIGEYGSIPGARITLTDETTGQELAVWP